MVTSVSRSRPEITTIAVPMADGGEGTVDALGGANRETIVSGPTGVQVAASWRMSGSTAVIEMAAASGLVLAGGASENDPLSATTYGTGELIEAALKRGARRIIIGVGGSATTDGGLGAIQAISSRARLVGVELIVAADVETKFLDAARVFGPQKGATKAQVAFLESRLRALARRYREEFGVDVESLAGAGAAGGLAGGLAAVGARIVSGFDLVAEEVGLHDAIAESDAVLTGEGRLDASSLDGKVVSGVMGIAREHGARVGVVVGEVAQDFQTDELAAQTVSLSERFGSVAAISNPVDCIVKATAELLASW